MEKGKLSTKMWRTTLFKRERGWVSSFLFLQIAVCSPMASFAYFLWCPGRFLWVYGCNKHRFFSNQNARTISFTFIIVDVCTLHVSYCFLWQLETWIVFGDKIPGLLDVLATFISRSVFCIWVFEVRVKCPEANPSYFKSVMIPREQFFKNKL